ncbi:tRNA (5-methylaminomethyl-2-thiouridine)(34)-methyltransferase MnmD [Bacteroidota bacterium]
MSQIKITKDGSHTLYHEKLDEHYHSVNGAIQESNHVFIKAGLSKIKQQEISILEIGFGTGLNAFLTVLESSKSKLKINYTSIELHPVEESVYTQLNYPSILGNKNLFLKLHKTTWNNWNEITDLFHLKKINKDLRIIQLYDFFDLVYFDAFSPKVQPELWAKDVFQKITTRMNKSAILTTYSAKGDVKRTLVNCGLKVEKISGPPGKMEMIRAFRL